MYGLYYYPDNASTFIHMLRRELAVPPLRTPSRRSQNQRATQQ